MPLRHGTGIVPGSAPWRAYRRISAVDLPLESFDGQDQEILRLAVATWPARPWSPPMIIAA